MKKVAVSPMHPITQFPSKLGEKNLMDLSFLHKFIKEGGWRVGSRGKAALPTAVAGWEAEILCKNGDFYVNSLQKSK